LKREHNRPEIGASQASGIIIGQVQRKPKTKKALDKIHEHREKEANLFADNVCKEVKNTEETTERT
jgi:hypothetical protein